MSLSAGTAGNESGLLVQLPVRQHKWDFWPRSSRPKRIAWTLPVLALLSIFTPSTSARPYNYNPSRNGAVASRVEMANTDNAEIPGDMDCSIECCARFLEDPLLPGQKHHRQMEEIATPCIVEEESALVSSPLPVQIFLITMLVLTSGLLSGLTLGLMSLDKTGLEIVMGGDDPAAAEAARRIYPLRANGNSLLCTLLLGNVAVNALLSILMAHLTSGVVGFIASTVIIVIFGEIAPQALCSRYALEIGSRSLPIVRVVRILLFPFTAPLSCLLDIALGDELGTIYSKSELLKIFEIHVSNGQVDQETGTAMTGALKYKDMTVKEVMTPLARTFMLDADEVLNTETIAEICETGYSRIPVFEENVNNIVGKIFVKDLISIDPYDNMQVRKVVKMFGRNTHVVSSHDKLGDVSRVLKKGRSHMAIVKDLNENEEGLFPFKETVGIITLEDIIEVIIGDEIFDETDKFENETANTVDETLSDRGSDDSSLTDVDLEGQETSFSSETSNSTSGQNHDRRALTVASGNSEMKSPPISAATLDNHDNASGDSDRMVPDDQTIWVDIHEKCSGIRDEAVSKLKSLRQEPNSTGNIESKEADRKPTFPLSLYKKRKKYDKLASDEDQMLVTPIV